MNWVAVYSVAILVVLLAIWLFPWPQIEDDCVVLRRITTENGVVEIVDDKCQEGLPHTTDSETIRMTEAIWNSPRKDEILVHERVHLDQKRRPDAWEDFYHSVWNYEITSKPPPDIPIKACSMLRPNPDTTSRPWATWRRRFTFFPIYGEDHTLKSAPVKIWDSLLKSFVDLPAEWKAEFCDDSGCPHQYEHPHELAAELLTLSSKSIAATKLRANIFLLNSRYGGEGSGSDSIQSH